MFDNALSTGPPAHNHPPILLADSGTTSHFATLDLPVLNKRISKNPIAITNPNGEVMYSTHEGELDIPGLPYEARKCHIVPDLACHSLLSIGQLCSAGCRVLFDTDFVTVYKNGKTILTGSRTLWTNNMWHMDIPPAAQHANAAIGTSTPAELVAFAHASIFSPALSTLTEALKRGYLKNCPGLSDKLLRRHPPQSYAMVKGHLDQSRKNQRPTATNANANNKDDIDEEFPSTILERANLCYATIIEPTGQIYTDLTGRFIAPSTTGNQYLFILYDHDSNCILAEPLKTRKSADILTAFKTLHTKLCKAGLPPQLQRLDNECSDSLKEFMIAEHIDYQLVPPNVHRRNAAERAIRTFKNHFVAGLCSVDKDFPIKLWDRLVEHAVISLNLIRGSRINPAISAWEQIHGKFDFNRTPLAPPGIRVLVHEKPAQRATWAPHAVDGWYIGPALEHYRCHQVWIWESNSSRICDTISWFPTKVTVPHINSNDLILSGVQTIVTALQNPSADTTLAPLQESHLDAVRRITTLLTDIAQPIATPLLRVERSEERRVGKEC